MRACGTLAGSIRRLLLLGVLPAQTLLRTVTIHRGRNVLLLQKHATVITMSLHALG